MAEVLGIIASGVSIASIAIQIVGSVQQVLDFWSSIRDAPTDIQDLLEEVQLLANLLLELDDNDNDPSGSSRQPTATKAAQYCKNAANSIDAVVKDLADGFAMSKGRRRWTAVKAVLKEKRMAKSLQRVERAKMMLSLAQQCYTQAQIKTMEEYQRQKFQTLEDMLIQSANQYTVSPALQKKTSVSSPTLGRALRATSGRKMRYGQTDEATYWTPLGVVVVQSKTTDKDPSDSEIEEGYMQDKGIQFRPMSWISQRGFSILSSRAYGRWQYSFRSYRIITRDDPVYAACVTGDLGMVKKLCVQGQATPFDTTSDGWSLLHVAAAFADPALCRWLIDQGLDGTVCGKLEGSLEDDYMGVIYPSGTYVKCFSGRPWRSRLIVADERIVRIRAPTSGKVPLRLVIPQRGMNRNRLADTLETLRVLVEHGQSDPTIRNAHGESTFSRFTGRVEHFNYLFQQEHFQVDLFQDKNEDFALTQNYARRFWSDSSKIALICLEQEKLIWEKTFHPRKPPELALAKTFAHMLHGAARHMAASHAFLEHGEDYFTEVRDLIKQAVASGTDIHIIADDYHIDETKHLTPLDRILAHQDIPETPQEGRDVIDRTIASMKRWLRALKDAGVDLKKYIREEERLATLNKMKEIWRGFRIPHYRVNWRIEVSENQEDCSVSIEYEFRDMIERKEEDRIPGGWIEEDWIHYVFAMDSSVVPSQYTWRRFLQGNEDTSSLSEGNTSEEDSPKPRWHPQGRSLLRTTSTISSSNQRNTTRTSIAHISLAYNIKPKLP